MTSLPIDQILCGDSNEILPTLPDSCVDMVFADPPYNLQLNKTLYRPDDTEVDAVNDEWDQFGSFEEYDHFTYQWAKQAKRILKDDGTLWVIGTYHNIFRIGTILQNLGFWILNDIIWRKTNPMPNFRGTRFTNAHETLLWCSQSQKSSYKFNYQSMKSLNDDLQMRSDDWLIPICRGQERLVTESGEKTHATQKPEALLHRVLLSSSDEGDVILDPFFGTGTTGAKAKQLGRHYIGIEKRPDYIAAAQKRIKKTIPLKTEALVTTKKPKNIRIPFATLIEQNLLVAGEYLYDHSQKYKALIHCDGSLSVANDMGEKFQGSIHKTSAFLQKATSSNGWDYWFFKSKESYLSSINELRKKIISQRKKA